MMLMLMTTMALLLLSMLEMIGCCVPDLPEEHDGMGHLVVVVAVVFAGKNLKKKQQQRLGWPMTCTVLGRTKKQTFFQKNHIQLSILDNLDL